MRTERKNHVHVMISFQFLKDVKDYWIAYAIPWSLSDNNVPTTTGRPELTHCLEMDQRAPEPGGEETEDLLSSGSLYKVAGGPKYGCSHDLIDQGSARGARAEV